MNVSKVIQESDIPLIIIKKNENFFAEAIWFCFNKSLEKNEFINCLKLANITPVFKERQTYIKNNYRKTNNNYSPCVFKDL